MRAFITGGAGFIGRALAQSLVLQGHNVTAYDVAERSSAEIVGCLNWHSIRGDILDADTLRTALRGAQPDVVFHLAAVHFIPYCQLNPATAFATNVGGTRVLLDAMSGLRLRPALVFTSSAAVYKDTKGTLSESSELGPIDIYGQTKRDAEELIRTFGDCERANGCTILRLFNVYGPGDSCDHVIPSALRQVRATARVTLGRLDTARDFVYIDDVVAALIGAAPPHGQHTYNIGTGSEHTVLDVVSHIAELLGCEIGISQDQSLVRATDRKHLVANIDKATSGLAWRPNVILRDGLERLLRHEKLIG